MHVEWWVALALPLMAAGIGGICSWGSLRLLFGPFPVRGREYSILERRTESVVDRVAAILSSQIRLADLFRLMEPEKVAAHVSDSVSVRLDEYVDEIMAERYSVLWANLPQALRQRVYLRAGRQLPAIMDNLVEDLAEHVDQLVDIRQLIEGLSADRQQSLARLLEQALKGERRFLIRAGVATGLVLGLLQAVFVARFPGVVTVLLSTTAIALATILVPRALLFPRDPATRHLSAFLLRDRDRLQQELARGFAEDVFSLHRIMQLMLTGPREARARSMIRRHMRPMLETGMVRTSVQVLLGAEGYAYIKQMVVDRVSELTLVALASNDNYQRGNARVETACLDGLDQLQAVELGELVQSVLDEALWQRVLAVLATGAVIGLLQYGLFRVLGG